jgi:Uma2 family endonuclease
MRSIELPGHGTVKLVFDSEYRLSEDDFLALCRANPDLRCERAAEREIVTVPPAGGEASYRSGDVFGQLSPWAKREARRAGADV